MEEQKQNQPEESLLRRHAETIIQKTLADVLPDKAVQEALEKRKLRGRVFVLSVGKAAWVMAEAAGAWLEGQKEVRLEEGLVVTKYGHGKGELPRFAVMEAGHPVPDENSVKAGREAVRFVQKAGEEDTVLFLLSGGGSALLELPEEGLSLSDIQDVTGQLLRCGADITEINLIRKKLSAVKGGKLAGYLKTKKAYSIILSDVVGGSEDMIASGLTYPDNGSLQDALRIVEKYGLKPSEPVENVLTREEKGEKPEERKQEGNETAAIGEKETAGAGEKETSGGNARGAWPVENHVVGSVRMLCLAAARHAEELGYHAHILTASMQGEAKEEGGRIALLADSPDYERPFALIAGGETVVKVTGKGLGGRNQELALSAARFLDGKENVLLFSLGSDGTDGPTDAAGGMVDGKTAKKLREKGIRLEEALRENDAYHALQAADGLILTGATGTNVNDVTVLLRA